MNYSPQQWNDILNRLLRDPERTQELARRFAAADPIPEDEKDLAARDAGVARFGPI